MADRNRLPVSTYDQAIWTLVKWDVAEAHLPDQLNLAVMMVADVFWVSEAKVRNDLNRYRRSVA